MDTFTLRVQALRIQTSNLEKGSLHGKDHYVFPASIMVEGVHNEVLWTAENLKDSAGVWGGTPIILNHPTNESGDFIPADTPDILSEFQVGQFFNSGYSDELKAITGDFYLEVEAVESIPGLTARIENGEVIELSVSYFPFEILFETGIFNGEAYKFIDKGFFPDHIAILPNKVGACSVEDGCGWPRTNTENESTKGVNTMLRLNAEEKKKHAALISDIVVYKNDDFKAEDLKDLSICMLEKVKGFLEAQATSDATIEGLEGKVSDLEKPAATPTPDEAEQAARTYLAAMMEELPIDKLKAMVAAFTDTVAAGDTEQADLAKKLTDDFGYSAAELEGMPVKTMRAHVARCTKDAGTGTDYSGKGGLRNHQEADDDGPGQVNTFGKDSE